MKYILPSLRLKLVMMLLLGLLYPGLMTVLSQFLFPHQALGGIIERGGVIVGSHLISQKFSKSEYFWPRPSAIDFNPTSSGGSNLGPTSQDLLKQVSDRKQALIKDDPDFSGDVPTDLIFSSGSGLDPHISPVAASFQSSRVAKARGLSEERIQALIKEKTEGPQWGLFGEATVNVLELNLALDHEQGRDTAPTLLPQTPAAQNPSPGAPIEAK